MILDVITICISNSILISTPLYNLVHRWPSQKCATTKKFFREKCVFWFLIRCLFFVFFAFFFMRCLVPCTFLPWPVEVDKASHICWSSGFFIQISPWRDLRSFKTKSVSLLTKNNFLSGIVQFYVGKFT